MKGISENRLIFEETLKIVKFNTLFPIALL